MECCLITFLFLSCLVLLSRLFGTFRRGMSTTGMQMDDYIDYYTRPAYSDKIRCENKYWVLLHGQDPVTSTAIVCTIAIVLLAVLIEGIAHIDYVAPQRPNDGDEERGTRSSSDTESSLDREEDAPLIHNPPSPQPTHLLLKDRIAFCTSSPSILTRLLRLIFTASFFCPTTYLLYIRLKTALTKPYIDPECASLVRWPGPDWAALVLLNIVPFGCAVAALARTVVDVVLWFKCGNLSYTRRWKARPWLPFMPLVVVGVGMWWGYKGARRRVVRVLRWWRAWREGRRGAVEIMDEDDKGMLEHIEGWEEKSDDEYGEERDSEHSSREGSSDAGEKGEKIV